MKSSLLVLAFIIQFFDCNIYPNSIAGTGGVVKGKIVDATSKVGLEYVTVAIYDVENNQLLGGAITQDDGCFKLSDVLPGSYYLDISYIGYATKRVDQIHIERKNHHLDVGIIYIGESSETIDEVEVVGQRASIDFKLDKKIVNVSKQYTSVSGSAVDVLENVPSVTVDIEGNVFLRGSAGFTVLIDGVPSILEPSEALQQMPASSIENIEIITNPSAKYNPDGTAGIINIITKKNGKKGFSGVSNFNVGTNAIGGDILINMQRKKMSYFLGTDYNYRNYPGDRNGYRSSNKEDTTFYVNYDGGMVKKFDRLNIRGGFEFRPDTMNTVNVDFNVGNKNTHDNFDLNYKEWNNYVLDPYEYTSSERQYRGSSSVSTNAVFIHKFDEHNDELKTTVSYSYSDSDEKNKNILYGEIKNKLEGRDNKEKGPLRTWQTNLDYIKNIGQSGTLEAGYQSRFNRSEDITSLFEDVDGSDAYVENTLYSNKTEYVQNIHSLYTIYGDQYKKLSYQFGLRGEYVYQEIKFVNKGVVGINNQNKSILDKFDYFPSVHLSYKLPKNNELMVSYSRRIERSSSYYLEPFYTWMDAYNIRKGNPDLLPEYVDSYEVNYLKKFDKAFVSFETYYRITHDLVEWVKTVYEDDIIQRVPENVGKDYSLGVDATFSFDLLKWWRIDLSGSFYNYKVIGESQSQNFREENLTWNTRFNNTFKINKTTQLQAYWRYYSKRVTSQGFYEPVYTFDLALKKEFYNRKLTGVLQVRDVFATNNRETTSQGLDFIDYYYQMYHTPILTFTFTYRFNNYKPDKKRRYDGNGSSFGNEVDVE